MDHPSAQRRRQYCARCNTVMFEYFLSPDGHFGLVSEVGREKARRQFEVACATCGAIYELLDKVDATGQPVMRKFRGT